MKWLLLPLGLMLVVLLPTVASSQVGTFDFAWSVPSDPEGVGVDPDGNIWVSSDDHMIRKYTPTGVLLLTIGGFGSGDGQFNFPFFFAFDPTGFIYVTDYANHRVQEFTLGGAFVRKWNVADFRATGIARDNAGNIYVSDYKIPSRIWKFTGDGTPVGDWSTGLDRVTGITIQNDILFALSSTNGSVAKSTLLGASAGSFVAPFGAEGYGIDADSRGRLLLAANSDHLISVFADGGARLGTFGSPGALGGELTNPEGLDVSSSDEAYVADRTNRRVQRFLLDCGTSPAASAGLIGWDAGLGTTPDLVCPTWALPGIGAPPVVACGLMTVSTSANGTNQYFLMKAPDVVIPSTFVAEFRVKFVSGSSSEVSRSPVAVGVITAPNTGTDFFIGRDEVFLLAGNLTRGQSAAVETDNDFHTYRLEIQGSAVSVSYDGVPTLTGTTFTDPAAFPAEQSVYWGEGSGAAYGTSEWAYFKHNASTVPCARPSGVAFLETFDGSSFSSFWQANSTPCGSPQLDQGELVLAQSAGCTGGPSLSMSQPTFTIQGDFDASVNFRLPDFTVPAAGEDRIAQVSINTLAGGFFATIERYNKLTGADCNPASQNYKSFFTTSLNCAPSVTWRPTADAFGKLRITRNGVVVRTFYWRNAWIETNVASLTAEDVFLQLAAGNPHGVSGLDARFDSLCIFATAVTAVGDPYAVPTVSNAMITRAWPNPSRGRTRLAYSLSKAGMVAVDVFDPSGRIVHRSRPLSVPAGEHAVDWDATDDSGRPAPSGLYFIRLKVDGAFVGARRVLLTR